MFRLMTWPCPRCGNKFHIEVEATSPAAREYRCQCPRCCSPVPVPGGDAGEPQEAPTPWAIRAEPVTE